MSLVRLLESLPKGTSQMQGFIRHWPGPNADPEAELLKAFPALNSGGQSLEKWWTLGLASLSAADRYKGLSLAETSRQLDGLLKFDVVIDKAGRKQSFTLDQYPAFKKAPGAGAALDTLSTRLLGLEVAGQSADAGGHCRVPGPGRATLSSRKPPPQVPPRRARRLPEPPCIASDQIADYLNWYEATQRTQASGSFDEYIRTADQLDGDAAARAHRSHFKVHGLGGAATRAVTDCACPD